MTTVDLAWANIGPDAWLLVDGPATATAGVIRAYLIGIEADDWLWRGVGGEGRSDSMEQAMVEAQLSVLLAMHPEALAELIAGDTPDEDDALGDDTAQDGPGGPGAYDGTDDDEDLIDRLLDPDA